MWIRAVAVLIMVVPDNTAFAWGAAGHRIVGIAAAELLCGTATVEIARLSGNESLGEIGQWADQIRAQSQWDHAAPWHFVNIPDSGNPRRPRVSADGNVIVAIERFTSTLRSRSATRQERAIALRFLVHFVADMHQPVHVGRASDRGGNLLSVAYGDRETSLHGFWDSDVIWLKRLSDAQYAEAIAHSVLITATSETGLSVRDWAAQVFGLREQVYRFDATTGRLDADYLDMAAALAEQQLVRASANLANLLNDIFCSG